MGWTPGESICSSAASLPCGKIPRVCGRAGSFGESIQGAFYFRTTDTKGCGVLVKGPRCSSLWSGRAPASERA